MKRNLGDRVPSSDCLIEINTQRTTYPKKHCCMGEVFTPKAFWEKEESYHQAGESLDVGTEGCGFRPWGSCLP